MAFRIGLKPAEFWALTPREFQLMVEAHNENSEAAHDARAWCLSTLICSLGSFRYEPNPRKMFNELSGRAAKREKSKADSDKIGEIVRKARERERVRKKEAEQNGRR